MSPTVSAIILNYRTGRVSWKSAEALLKQTVADALEILIVDNHSDDDSMGYLRNRVRLEPRVRLAEAHENLGYGQGNGFGASLTKGEYILIINPDNELEPAGLEKMMAMMEKDPTIGLIAPMLVHEDGTIRDSFRTFPTLIDLVIKRSKILRKLFPARMHRYLQHDQDPRVTRDVDWVAGACLLLRRSFFEELGGFDPRFFLFFEDTDLCRRVHKHGKRVLYYAEVHAKDSKHRLSEGSIWALFTKKTARIHLASAFKYFWKWRNA